FWPGAVAGAVVGGALASGAYYGYGPGYYDDSYGYYDDSAPVAVEAAPGGDASYCAQRYRSYDPASGTYLGFDGLRHPCP
ncbi:BA14K family protein, partial [Bradyrhizobium uaiense]